MRASILRFLYDADGYRLTYIDYAIYSDFKVFSCFYKIQGGSDKSGILKIFLKNRTAQLKIIRFF
jgi:hypothetical protein